MLLDSIAELYSRVLENPEVTHSMKQNSDTCGVGGEVFWPLVESVLAIQMPPRTFVSQPVVSMQVL